MTRRAWWQPSLARLALALVSVLATLMLAEGALRWRFRGTVDAMLASRTGVSLDGQQRILCVGDSYTFGLHYRAEESFPSRLEGLLNEGETPKRWSVINAGVPGQNTAQIAAALPEQLAEYRPDVVVVLAGHNNRWNLADPERASAWASWWRGLALVRLARIAKTPATGVTGPDRITAWGDEEVGVNVGGQERLIDLRKTEDRRDDDALIASCRRDFAVIAERCEAAGARLLLTCYPSPEPGYAAPQEAARDSAKAHGALFVDVRETFAQRLASRPYHELLIPGDRHPTPVGHFHLACDLAGALAEAGWAEAVDVEGQPEELYPASLRWEDGVWTAEGPPRAACYVIVARSAEPPQPYGARTLPVANDDLHRAWLAHERLSAQFDDEGRATIPVPSELAQQAQVAALVVLNDHQVKAPDLLVRSITGPLRR